VAISRDLLGKVLCSIMGDELTKAIIVETEAYAGVGDRASHAYGGRRTKRTEPMYKAGGIAYIYLCYGIHHLFNVVTSARDIPNAVLVRAGLPLVGVHVMQRRRANTIVDKTLLAGPGSLSRGLGITTDFSGESLLGNQIWIEEHGIELTDSMIRATPRVGIDYSGEDALRPYRFILDANRL